MVGSGSSSGPGWQPTGVFVRKCARISAPVLQFVHIQEPNLDTLETLIVSVPRRAPSPLLKSSKSQFIACQSGRDRSPIHACALPRKSVRACKR